MVSFLKAMNIVVHLALCLPAAVSTFTNEAQAGLLDRYVALLMVVAVPMLKRWFEHRLVGS